MGFVSRVVPQSNLEAIIRQECDQIARNAPLTIRAAKIAIDEILRAGPQLDAARCEAATDAAFGSEDFTEGWTAFEEKRDPIFIGR